MNIEDVEGSVSFEETENGVIMFISFTHPEKTTKAVNSDLKFPLTANMNWQFSKDSEYYKSIENFFR